MIKKIVTPWYWLKILSAFEEGSYAKVLSLIERIDISMVKKNLNFYLIYASSLLHMGFHMQALDALKQASALLRKKYKCTLQKDDYYYLDYYICSLFNVILKIQKERTMDCPLNFDLKNVDRRIRKRFFIHIS